MSQFSRGHESSAETCCKPPRSTDFRWRTRGGIELFRTPQAKLLLAWLRILESDTDRGWAVILEEAGYTLNEIKHILETEAYPENMRLFCDKLVQLETLGGVAERVFSRYGYDGATADVVLHTIQSVHIAMTLTRGDLIRFIERGIEAGSIHDVHANAGAKSVTVQTIHAAKGLEHLVVVLANMNSERFPLSGGGSSLQPLVNGCDLGLISELRLTAPSILIPDGVVSWKTYSNQWGSLFSRAR